MPSVATALALARALRTSVEALFDDLPHSEAIWADQPTRFPCRFWSAEVAGRTVLYAAEGTTGLAVRPDGKTEGIAVASQALQSARQTIIVATCDPAANFLALEYARQTPFRMIVLRRSSRQAMELVASGLAHVAGVHLAESRSAAGNQSALARAGLRSDVRLLAVAKWEEGVAHSPAVKLRSVKQAASAKLRWIGRSAGAGARRCQDEVLGGRRLPRHVATDHTDVVASIRSGFADAGVCVRLVAEEAQDGVSFRL